MGGASEFNVGSKNSAWNKVGRQNLSKTHHNNVGKTFWHSISAHTLKQYKLKEQWKKIWKESSIWPVLYQTGRHGGILILRKMKKNEKMILKLEILPLIVP